MTDPRPTRKRSSEVPGLPLVSAAQEPLGCESCETLRARVDLLQRQVDQLSIDCENFEVELRVKRRENSRLKNELAKQRANDPRAAEAREVFEYWKRICRPKARAFGDDRMVKVLARLNDEPEAYTVADLKKAIRGARIGAFVSVDGQRHDDLELICRTPSKVDRFMGIYDRWEAAQNGTYPALPSTDADEVPEEQLEIPELYLRYFAEHGRMWGRYDELGGPGRLTDDEVWEFAADLTRMMA